MTTQGHPEGIDGEQTAPVWPCAKLARALLKAAEQGSEEGVEVRPQDVGLPVALVQPFHEAAPGDPERLPQTLLDACEGDFSLYAALRLLTTLSAARPGSPPETFALGWRTFSSFALALLRRTHTPSGLAVEPPADGDWRKATLAMLEKASVATRAVSTRKSLPDAGRRNRGSVLLEQGGQALRPQQDAPTPDSRAEPDVEYLRSLLQPFTFSCLRRVRPARGAPAEVLGRWQIALVKMKTAAELACYVDMASDKPYACIEEAFEANRFASLTRRMMAEAARLELDTDPIGDVFALFCGLFCVPLPFIRPDAAFDVASWRSFCQAELARYARLEPRARAIAARVLALHDGGAPGQGKEIAGRHGMPSTTLGSVHGHTLARRYQRAWTQYTRAIQQGGFDGTPTDRDAYGWLLQNEGDLSGMPEFHTWGRYLRGARNFHGAQKNQPRHGRAHGGSVVLSKDISRLTRTARG